MLLFWSVLGNGGRMSTDALHMLFGAGDQLNPLQMSARAVVIFSLTLLSVRISGRRSFGQHRPFDQVVAILLGAVASRAVVGASPFVATTAAMLVIVLLHRGLGWLSMRWPWIQSLVNGQPREIFRDGRPLRDQMRRGLISEDDLLEAARMHGHDDLSRIHRMVMERDGRIAIVVSSSDDGR
jgi:uncharacterized membrane protein YcaP (DUF421 family)